MGKGNKNTKRNAYYFFMEEFRNQQGRKLTMADAAVAAGPFWQKLTPKQRQKYENMAKATKESQYKQTSLGESVDVVLQQDKDKKERETDMKHDIDTILKRAMNTETIAEQYFYLMHINEFCYCETAERYYPAEIALGKFNLRDGIIKEDVYHSLVQPGPLPLGYAANAKAKSEETHQIQHGGCENNTHEVFTDIITKLSEDVVDDNFPPIYVSEKDVLLIENVLNHMCADNGQNFVFKLYSLQYLLFSLRNHISSTDQQSKVWPTISVSKLELEKDVYDFCTGIACPYHENSEIPVYCSRSQIIRWAYIICDNCIRDLNIPFIPGRHVPRNALTNQKLVASASGLSIKSNASCAGSLSYASSSTKYHSDNASETSTVVDESEISSYHGFDSDSQAADDEEEWRRPRRSKYRTPQHLSQQSHQSDCNSQLSQSSSNAEYTPSRRPLSQSAVVPGLQRLTLNNMCGRGRGRGVLQTRPPM